MDNKTVDIIIRDINGKWTTIHAPFYAVAAKVKECVCEEEIMLISMDGMVLWCALGRDIPLSIEDITGFFA